MKSSAPLIAALAVGLSVAGAPAGAHEGHEIDRELLASKIRERGHACVSVSEASEKSAKPTVIAVKCSDDNSYRLVISETDFEVTPTSSPPAPQKSE